MRADSEMFLGLSGKAATLIPALVSGVAGGQAQASGFDLLSFGLMALSGVSGVIGVAFVRAHLDAGVVADLAISLLFAFWMAFFLGASVGSAVFAHIPNANPAYQQPFMDYAVGGAVVGGATALAVMVIFHLTRMKWPRRTGRS